MAYSGIRRWDSETSATSGTRRRDSETSGTTVAPGGGTCGTSGTRK